MLGIKGLEVEIENSFINMSTFTNQNENKIQIALHDDTARQE